MNDDANKRGERPETLQQRIRDLAYFMWEAGGRQHGRALEYWLEAERVVLTFQHEDTPTASAKPAQTLKKDAPPPGKDEA